MSEEVEKKYNIVRSIGEECIQEDELKNLLAKKPTPICYDGFEPSGRMHIAQVSYHSVIAYFIFLEILSDQSWLMPKLGKMSVLVFINSTEIEDY